MQRRSGWTIVACHSPLTSRLALLIVVCLVAGCGQKTGPMGGKPVNHWVEELHNPDWRSRKKAVFKLGNIGSAEAWPVVCGVLTDPDPHVRAEALAAVLKFGPTAQEAVPTLQEIQRNDKDPNVRSLASRALDKIEPARAAGEK